MKNKSTVLGVIALVAVIGFSMAACDSGGDGDSSYSGDGGGGDTYRYTGPFTLAEITFNGSNCTMNTTIFKITITIKGTYVVENTTITCTAIESNDPDTPPGDIKIFTIISPKQIRDEDGRIWTKK